jgi:hypothetical protein
MEEEQGPRLLHFCNGGVCVCTGTRASGWLDAIQLSPVSSRGPSHRRLRCIELDREMERQMNCSGPRRRVLRPPGDLAPPTSLLHVCCNIAFRKLLKR